MCILAIYKLAFMVSFKPSFANHKPINWISSQCSLWSQSPKVVIHNDDDDDDDGNDDGNDDDDADAIYDDDDRLYERECSQVEGICWLISGHAWQS